MGRRLSRNVEFKRHVAQEYLGGATLHGLARRHDISRNLVRVWVGKREAGSVDEDANAADPLQAYKARISALERSAGKQALELEFLKGALRSGAAPGSGPASAIAGPAGLSVARGRKLMGIARSTVHDPPPAETDGTALVEAVSSITGEFEAYDWRRVRAALRQKGGAANRKKTRRPVREHGLRPRMRRRSVVTADNGHDGPVFPNFARDFEPGGPDQPWLVDITYRYCR